MGGTPTITNVQTAVEMRVYVKRSDGTETEGTIVKKDPNGNVVVDMGAGKTKSIPAAEVNTYLRNKPAVVGVVAQQRTSISAYTLLA